MAICAVDRGLCPDIVGAMRILSCGLVAVSLFLGGCQLRESASGASLKSGVNKPRVAGNHIINLYDAFGRTDERLMHAFGFAALIRFNGKTILFDSGGNAKIFKRNVETLGIDLREVDFVVASHAHFDHINGLDYVLEVHPKVKIYFPSDMFWGGPLTMDVTGPETDAASRLERRRRYFAGLQTKFDIQRSGRFWKADVEYVADHKEIAPGIDLIATKSPFIGYFTRYPSLPNGEKPTTGSKGVKTIPLPELSLSLRAPGGDVLVVGCSHSQVETIVSTTKAQLKREIGLVYGGYHLLPYNSTEVRGIATRMKDDLGVRAVAPTHCSGHIAFRVFKEVFGARYYEAGLGTTTAFPDSVDQ